MSYTKEVWSIIKISEANIWEGLDTYTSYITADQDHLNTLNTWMEET